jgi:hypothetical protein
LIDDDANLRFPKLRKGRSRSDEKSIILTCTYICPDFDWLVILSPVIVNLHPCDLPVTHHDNFDVTYDRPPKIKIPPHRPAP